MQASDLEGFTRVILQTASTFGVKADPPLIEGYWIALKDLPFRAVQSACEEATKKNEFFPRPVELRRLAGDQPPEALAAVMWPTVLRLARESGSPRAREIAKQLDPVASEAVRQMGGAQRLGQMESEKLHAFGRKEFERLYSVLNEKHSTESRLLQLQSPHDRKLLQEYTSDERSRDRYDARREETDSSDE